MIVSVGANCVRPIGLQHTQNEFAFQMNELQKIIVNTVYFSFLVYTLKLLLSSQNARNTSESFTFCISS